MTLSFVWVLLSLALFGALHSFLASRRFKSAIIKRFGPSAMRWHRFAFSILSGLTILPTLALVLLLPDRSIYQLQRPYSGWLNFLQLLGAVGFAYGVLQTGFLNFIGFDRVLNPAAVNRPPRLVITGLYRWMRHPLYTSAMLLLWASPTFTWNRLALNLGVSLYFIIGSIFEEQKLREEFGEAYLAYRRRMPAFLPFPRPRE